MANEGGGNKYGKIHQSLERGVSPFHSRIADIDRQISELTAEKSVLRVAALREISTTLSLAEHEVGQLAAACR